jgi:phage shock protein C
MVEEVPMNEKTDQIPAAGRAPGPERPSGPPPATWYPPPASETGERPLRRSRTNQVVAGVCGGLGQQLGIDPVLLRIAFVVLALANGVGIPLYVIAAIVIPEEPRGLPPVQGRPADPATGRVLVGVVLVGLGVVLLADRFVPVADRIFWPLIVIAIGLGILLKGVRR